MDAHITLEQLYQFWNLPVMHDTMQKQLDASINNMRKAQFSHKGGDPKDYYVTKSGTLRRRVIPGKVICFKCGSYIDKKDAINRGQYYCKPCDKATPRRLRGDEIK